MALTLPGSGIVYPLALPMTRFQRSSFYLDRYESAQESLMSRNLQTVSIGGGTLDRWQGVLQTAPLTRAEARQWQGWLDALRGVAGCFLLADPGWDGAPAGSQTHAAANGQPVIAQTPTQLRTLALSGLAASAVVLRAGDYFSVGDELKRVVLDVTSNASGRADVHFEPALRTMPPAGAAVNITAPTVTARLQEPHGSVEIGMRSEPISFAWVEMLL